MYRPAIGPEDLAAVGQVLHGRWLGPGEQTRQFEDRVRALAGTRHAIAVSSCTAALHLALEALDLETGDEVIVPSLTYCADVQAILAAGGTPVFCEVSPETLNLDADDALARITSRTRAILPVHFAGQVCDMERLWAATREAGIALIADAAHAFGSSRTGRPVGQLADATCFSFGPLKNITCGDGGAITTDDDGLAERVARRRQLGFASDTWTRLTQQRTGKYAVIDHGFRYHLNNLAAALGLSQLSRLESFRQRRLTLAKFYDRAFASLPNLCLLVRCDLEAFPHMYVVRVLDGSRDALVEHLQQQRIETAVQYPPNHLQPAFAAFGQPLPVTEQLAEQIVSLPFFVEMTSAEQQCVIAAVVEFMRSDTVSGSDSSCIPMVADFAAREVPHAA
ncbi:MAG: DegT/DnrJ/EryC1/StrS family aminotransferase [Planctomycetota bacterium]